VLRVTCYVSRVTCYVSWVTSYVLRVACHVSRVTCHVIRVGVCNTCYMIDGGHLQDMKGGLMTPSSLQACHTSHVTRHPSPFTLHPSPFTLHPSPFTLHPPPASSRHLLLHTLAQVQDVGPRHAAAHEVKANHKPQTSNHKPAHEVKKKTS